MLLFFCPLSHCFIKSLLKNSTVLFNIISHACFISSDSSFGTTNEKNEYSQEYRNPTNLYDRTGIDHDIGHQKLACKEDKTRQHVKTGCSIFDTLDGEETNYSIISDLEDKIVSL